jgi:hypothetical protein
MFRYVVLPKGDMHAFNDALANVGPLSVGIDATQPSFYFYAGGLFDDPNCGKTLDHIVLAVGYVTVAGQKYTLVKNSWSTYWGQGGYILVSQRNNDCGLANGASYPLMAAEQPGAQQQEEQQEEQEEEQQEQQEQEQEEEQEEEQEAEQEAAITLERTPHSLRVGIKLVA